MKHRVIPSTDANSWIVQTWLLHWGGFWQDTFVTPSLVTAFAHIQLMEGR